jgi:Mg2+-importing ATPase
VGVEKLDDAQRGKLLTLFEAKGAQGLRLLGIAQRPMPPGTHDLSRDDEAGLVFAGCAAFIDPPKASAGVAARQLAAAGVRVKVISETPPRRSPSRRNSGASGARADDG